MDKPLTCVTVFPACTYMRLWCGFVGLGFSVVGCLGVFNKFSSKPVCGKDSVAKRYASW